MAARDDPETRRLRADLIARLADGGYLTKTWRPVFERVPRHCFMPRLFVPIQDGRYMTVDRQADREQWLKYVYADELCTTQLNGEDSAWLTATAHGAMAGVQTCTSTQPSLMAWMLNELDLQDGHRILEIGCGTGYNAGLLSERLGDRNVTTIDVDASLVSNARKRLAALGYHPTVAVRDGREGYPENAPYDRVISTCSFPNLPYSWIKQIRPSGRIIMNVSGTLGGAMLMLCANRDNTAHGQFLYKETAFLPARGMLGVGDITPKDTSEGAYSTRTTYLSPEALDDPAFAFLAWLATQDARLYWAEAGDGRQLTCLIGLDGSWCEVYPEDNGKRRVDEGGPRQLWTLVEDAYKFWEDRKRPRWSDFGVVITPEKQSVWFEHPSQTTAWCLPSQTMTGRPPLSKPRADAMKALYESHGFRGS